MEAVLLDLYMHKIWVVTKTIVLGVRKFFVGGVNVDFPGLSCNRQFSILVIQRLWYRWILHEQGDHDVLVHQLQRCKIHVRKIVCLIWAIHWSRTADALAIYVMMMNINVLSRAERNFFLCNMQLSGYDIIASKCGLLWVLRIFIFHQSFSSFWVLLIFMFLDQVGDTKLLAH